MSKDVSEELGELLDDCNVQVTMTGWKAELIKTEKELKRVKAKADELADALSELIDLMEGVREGDYRPDSFTCQPARIALKNYQEDNE